MDLVTRLSVSTNQKGEIYDSILVIVDRLTKMAYYELVKVTINTPALAIVIIDVVVQYHSLPDLIVIDQGLVFTLKFWSSLQFFLGIKQTLSTTFQPWTDGQRRGKIVQQKPTFKPLSILNKIIGPDFYQQLNSPTIIQRTPIQTIHPLSLTANIPQPFMKKTLILASGQNQQMPQQPSSKN